MMTSANARWGLCLLALLLASSPRLSRAQRDVHWQIEPIGFPSKVTVFADVEESWSFLRDLSAADFSISVDEYVGDQGGRILDPGDVKVGNTGAQVLMVIDRSQTYTGEFPRAKTAMRDLVTRLDPARDQLAVVSTSSGGGYSDIVVEQPFTADRIELQRTIDRLTPLAGADPPRICHALAEALRVFPEERTRRYRAVVLLSAGIDRGEGRGDCVQRSHQAGKVPFFLITFTPERRYRDTSNEHRIENALDELASQTSGRSIFQPSTSQALEFVNKLVYRIRNQYRLEVEFPCYRPAPATEHLAVLKVQGRDAEGLRFEAPSALAPVPQIDTLLPSSVSQRDVDDGDVEVTIEGHGFCGAHGAVKAYLGDRPIAINSQDPYRVVVELHPDVETGDVKVINRFGEVGESEQGFKVISPAPGEDASTTLTVLVLAIVCMVVIGVLLFAFRSRKATIDAAAKRPPEAAREAKPREPLLVGIDAAETVPMRPIGRAWVELSNGKRVALDDGSNLIGRDRTCTIRLDIPGVSREHAKIEMSSVHGVLWLEDLGSTNGTYWGEPGAQTADAERIGERRQLGSGDVIVIGGERMTIFFDR